MGKLHSKFSSKCRQSPEGGVLVSSLLNSQKEVEHIPGNKEKMFVNMHRDEQSLQKVTLPPEQWLDKSRHEQSHSANQDGSTFTDNPKQEWVFTTETGNKEDVSNFLHGVCKAIDASVKPTDSTTTLKVKIVLNPSDVQPKEKKQETGRPMSKVYSVGENIERRNHYLDLAGIENFTSKFEDEEFTYQKHPYQHHLVATRDNCMQKECQCFSAHDPGRSRPVWREGKSSRLHVHHPAFLCRHHSSSFKHDTNGPVHRSKSKILRTHSQKQHTHRPLCCHNQEGKHCDTTQPPCLCPPLRRHDHHHLHEHHHHHHHHYHAA